MSRYLAWMFVREKKNKRDTVSIQIIDKSCGSYRVAKTVGSSSNPDEIAYLLRNAYAIIPTLVGQTSIDFRSQPGNRSMGNHFVCVDRRAKSGRQNPTIPLGCPNDENRKRNYPGD